MQMFISETDVCARRCVAKQKEKRLRQACSAVSSLGAPKMSAPIAALAGFGLLAAIDYKCNSSTNNKKCEIIQTPETINGIHSLDLTDKPLNTMIKDNGTVSGQGQMG